MSALSHARDVRQEFLSPPALPWLEIRSTYDSVQPYAPHMHAAFSVGVILGGRTCFTCNDEPRVAVRDDIVLIEPYVAHQCNPVAGESRSYHMLYIDPEAMIRLGGQPFASARGVRASRRLVRDIPLARALARAVADLTNGKDSAAEDMTALIRRLVAACCVPEPAGALPPALEKRAARTTMARAETVREAATLAGLRRESFIRAFRRAAGLPPGAWRQCQRLEEARRLLRLGYSITEAALAAGYTDQSHFHRMFVKYYAATPRQYCRRSHLYKK